MTSMNRPFNLSGVIISTTAVVLFVFGAIPAFSQSRPSPGAGGGEHAVSRPSGGSSAPAPSSEGGSTTSSSGGTSAGSSAGSSGGGGDHAVSRGSGREGRGGRGAGAARGGGTPRSVVLPARPSAYDPGDRGAPVNRAGSGESSRPRGDRPATGRAVPRDITNVPIPPNWGNDWWYYNGFYNGFYGSGWANYGCMYYYGCLYYDPYWFDYYYGYAPGYYGGGGGGYVSSGQADYDTGALKLKVKPRNAQVYVDGYFSGVVDDFDGMLQKLKLRAGAHRVELRAEGYQPSIFDVLVVEGETVTYRAELKPKQ